jgi:hypothetical protein
MTTAFRASRIAEADDGAPDAQRPTLTRRMARFLDASTLDIRTRPANPHEPMSTQATQHLDFTLSHPSEIPLIRPDLGAGGRRRAM